MEAEKEILDLAVKRGILSRSQADEGIEFLIRKGIVDDATLQSLRADLEARVAAPTVVDNTNPQVQPSGAFAASAETRISRFGRFENLTFIGQGGMARVYQAFDAKMGRLVALKMLRVEDSEMSARLLLEAKAQARIEHPNVCKVYETGEVDGSPYIVMQLIRGKTMKEIRNQLSRELKLKLIAQAADGVHAAHRAGLIHRDLKPANVMVERGEDGEFIPYVMDFGLAREIGSGGLTETGRVIGTIHYMSPEQARGHVRRLDRRSDIYSLGVTLYEMIADHLPYDFGSDMDFLVSLVDETKPLVTRMDPEVPDDLQTIVMKCVDKEPRRRYDSAKALAEDLRRYLDGEPILAKRAHFAYWLWKKAKKHRLLVAIFALVATSFLALLVSWARARSENAERIRIAQELGQKVERIESALRYSRLLPLHNARNEIQAARHEVDQILLQINNRSARAGEAPAYYAAGRGYLALGDLDRAREYLEKAWDAGYRTADVSYALGRALGALYQREIDELEQSGTRLSREQKKKQLEKEYREPALRHLQKVSGSNLLAPDYDRALLAYYDGRYEDALDDAAAAHSRIPWLYEALRLKGDVFAAQARERDYRGDFDGALTLFGAAEQAYAAAIKIGSSDSENYERLCRMKTAVIKSVFYTTSLEPRKEFEQAVAYCDQAVLADPANATALASRAMAFNRWGEYLLFNGQDPEPALNSAAESAQKASLLNPRDHYPHHNIGFAYSLLSNYRTVKNRNPLPEIARSSDHYRKALELEPGYASSLSGIGLVNLYKAEYLSSVGGDPIDAFETSLRHRLKAVENDPSNTDMLNNLGNAYNTYAQYLIDSGGNPEANLRGAVEVLRKAVRINPDAALVRANLIAAYLSEIHYLQTTGRDPSAAIARCVVEAEEHAKRSPDHELTWQVLIEAYLARAENEILAGTSPEDSLNRASPVLEIVLQNSGESNQPHWYLGQMDLLAARANRMKKRSPEQLLARAADGFLRELEQSPMNPTALASLAECYLEAAEWKRLNRRLPATDVRRGMEVVEKMLHKNPRNSQAHLMKARFLMIDLNAANRSTKLAQARESLETALQINNNLKSRVSELVARLEADSKQ